MKTDSGYFQCMGKNEVAEVQSVAQLIVLDSGNYTYQVPSCHEPLEAGASGGEQSGHTGDRVDLTTPPKSQQIK